MAAEIIVVTGAYGRQQVVDAGGQQAFIPVIAEAGADGVEIRRELFTDEALRQLPALASAIRNHSLTAFYSVPDPLFSADGVINPQLPRFFVEAEQLGAKLIKFSRGCAYGDISAEQLAEHLAASPVPVTLENDQTPGGTITAMEQLMARYGQLPQIAGMTFDTGNWCWLGESPREACQRLSHYVSYIHIKVATRSQSGLHATPPALNGGDWQHWLAALPDTVPRGIEFPLVGDDLSAVTRQYVSLLRDH